MADAIERRKSEKFEVPVSKEGILDKRFSDISENVSGSIDLGSEELSVSGDVSEKVSAKKGEGAKASFGGQSQASIKSQLLADLPSERIMRVQIEDEIKKEIKTLKKEAMRLIKSGHRNSPFELTNVVRKLRYLNNLLNSLLKISVDKLKNLWLRFVHGI